MKRAESKDRELWFRIVSTRPAAYWRQFKNFGTHDARTLRRAEMTLRRWAELECGDGHAYIERDEVTDRPRIYREGRSGSPNDPRQWSAVPDREAGALRRVEAVCEASGLYYFHQTDPRGCALYVSAEPLTYQNYSTRGIPCL